MSYTVRKSHDKKDPQPYKIIKRETGEIVGSSRTEHKAWSSIKHREEGSREKVKNYTKKGKKRY